MAAPWKRKAAGIVATVVQLGAFMSLLLVLITDDNHVRRFVVFVSSQVGGGAELLVWAKVPGDSDGPCGIGPGIPAGQFSPDLAIRLIEGR